MSGPLVPGSITVGAPTPPLLIPGPHLLIAIPTARSALNIQGLIRIESHKPPPNFWWRFWHWLFFGWRWERL